MKKRTVIALGSLAFIFLVLAVTVASLPSYGQPVMDSAGYILDNAVKQTGAENIVCSIVLDYRGYDTLGEATVWFAAVMGVVAVLKVNK